jgi:ABC-type methionine transport system permease subunit
MALRGVWRSSLWYMVGGGGIGGALLYTISYSRFILDSATIFFNRVLILIMNVRIYFLDESICLSDDTWIGFQKLCLALLIC